MKNLCCYENGMKDNTENNSQAETNVLFLDLKVFLFERRWLYISNTSNKAASKRLMLVV